MDPPSLKHIESALAIFASHTQRLSLYAPPPRPVRRPQSSPSSQSELSSAASSLQATLNRLKNHVDDQRRLAQEELCSHAGELFDELCRHLAHDTEQLCRALDDLATGHQINETVLHELRHAAMFHEEVLQLLEQYLDLRGRARNLNRRVEFDEQLERFDDDIFRFDQALKNDLFEGSAISILPRTSESSTSNAKRHDSHPSQNSYSLSDVLLYKIHGAAEKISPDFPHGVSIGSLIPMVLHWLSGVRSLQMMGGANGDKINDKVYWHSVKSCWLLHCVRSHRQLRESGAGIGNVVNLLTCRTMVMLGSVHTVPKPSMPSVMNLDSTVGCPPPPHYAGLSHSDTSGASLTVHSSSNDVSSESDQSNLVVFEPAEDEVELANLALDEEAGFHRPGFHENIHAALSPSDLSMPSNDDYWPCHVHVFRRRSSTGSVRICTSLPAHHDQQQRYKSVNMEPPIELVPEYAYDRASRLIRFRRSSSPAGDFCYRFPSVSPPSQEIYAFHSVFTSDEWLTTCDGAVRVEFKRSSSTSITTMAEPTVQIWADPPVTLPDLSLSQPDTSDSTPPSRVNIRIEAISNKYSPSKLVVFANYCIYTIFITEKARFSHEQFKVLIRPVNQRAPLRVNVQKGTRDRPAGIHLGDKVAQYENEHTFIPHDSITVHFKWDAWSRLKTEIEDLKKEWNKAREKNIQARATQRDPKIKTKSEFFRFGPRPREPP